MAASRPAETPGAPRGWNWKTRPSGIRISGFPLQKRRRDVPGGERMMQRNRKEKTTRRNRDERTMREEKGRQSRETQKQRNDEKVHRKSKGRRQRRGWPDVRPLGRSRIPGSDGCPGQSVRRLPPELARTLLATLIRPLSLGAAGLRAYTGSTHCCGIGGGGASQLHTTSKITKEDPLAGGL
ncbi:hypothetical protein NDU88_003056 [Pleurodeles waltl]|uniref:Uncharacterized protein n=1 Tax=Pleurodeles waltl TaxID=8319 RepID=A0AAV7MPG0_PLEWA|nr:hypothetical protein NDU88_003056 [Pleurodeles waltl]